MIIKYICKEFKADLSVPQIQKTIEEENGEEDSLKGS